MLGFIEREIMKKKYILPEDKKHMENMINKSWDDLKVIEHNEIERLLVPGVISKRKLDGTFETTDIMIRPLRENELRKCRTMARVIAKEDGIDEEKDKQLFENIEEICKLTFAIRETEHPHISVEDNPRHFEKKFDKHTIRDMVSQLDHANDLLNPRLSDLTENELMVIISKVATEENMRPFLLLEPGTAQKLIVFMASLLHPYLTEQLSHGQSEP